MFLSTDKEDYAAWDGGDEAMCLNSAVDAPLNTGIVSYRQIFFSPNPERAEIVEKLRPAIDEQVDSFFFCAYYPNHLTGPGPSTVV